MHTCGYTLQRIHTPAPQQTQIDTYTDGHTHTRMQQHAKQTRTGVWCPSFHLRRSYSLSLSLWLSPSLTNSSQGGVLLLSCDTLLLLLQFVCERVSACVHRCSCAYIWLYGQFCASMHKPPLYMSIRYVCVCVWAHCQAALCLPTVPPLRRLSYHQSVI